MPSLFENKEIDNSERRQFIKTAGFGAIGATMATYSPKSESFVFVSAAKITGEIYGEAANIPLKLGWTSVEELWKYLQAQYSKMMTEMEVRLQDLRVQSKKDIENNKTKADTEPSPFECDVIVRGESIADKKIQAKSAYSDLNSQGVWQPASVDNLTSATNISSGMYAYAKSINGNQELNDDDVFYYRRVKGLANLNGVEEVELNNPSVIYLTPAIGRELLSRAIENKNTSEVISNSLTELRKEVAMTYANPAWRENIESRASSVGLLSETSRLIANNNLLANASLQKKEQELLTKALQLIEIQSQIRILKNEAG